MSERLKLKIIYMTVFIDLIGFGMVIPILPLYAREFGASAAANGWLVGTFSAVQFFSAPWLGAVSDRVGRRPVLLLSLLGTAAGFILMGMAQSLVYLFIARMIAGFCGGNISTAQAYIADITRPEERSKAMGMFGAAFGLGFILGPVFSGFLSRFSIGAPFYFAGGLAILNALFVWFFLPESLSRELRSGSGKQGSLRELLRHGKGLPLLVGAYFLVIAGFSIMTANYALFTAERFGLDTTHNGYLFGFIGLLGALMQGVALRFVLRVGSERSIAIAGGVILALGLGLLPFSEGVGSLLVFTALIAVGNSLITPVLNGLASRNTERRWQGRVIGVMQAAGSLGRWLGPIAGGYLLAFDTSGRYGLYPFLASAGVMIAAALCLSFLPRQDSPAPEPVNP